MAIFGNKSIYKLEGAEAAQLKSLNERLIRWQEKQISLLTFSINLLFTISIATIGLIINNLDKPLFSGKTVCGFHLSRTTGLIITISAITGIIALFCRLNDFRSTKTTVKTRILLFKVKNNIQYENCKELSQKELESKIKKLNCFKSFLGSATWFFFYLQAIFFLTSLLLIVCNI